MSILPYARTSVADPGFGAFLTPGPGSGIGEKTGSGTGIRIRNDHLGSYFIELRNLFFGLKYLIYLLGIQDPLEKFGWAGKHSDPRWKTFVSGIRDKHPGSATLVRTLRLFAGKIRAHKFLLRLVSEVFLTQFSPRFSDSNQGEMPPVFTV
jgi:hypothetical protein